MSREWKRGDVALVLCSDDVERVAICGERWVDDSLVWVFGDRALRDVDNSTARRVAIVDPEDAEQVERLLDLIRASDHGLDCPSGTCQVQTLASALREFANPTPPKPEEPTGLGAVVETDLGERVVRCFDGWIPAHGPYREPMNWGDVRAIRVLSSGVEADA